MNTDDFMKQFMSKIRIIKLQYIEERDEVYFRIKNKGYAIYKYYTEPMKYLEYVKEVEHNQQESYSDILPDYAKESLNRNLNIEGYSQIMYFLEKDYYDSFPVLSKAVELPVYAYKDKNTDELVKFCLLSDFMNGHYIDIKPRFKTKEEANNWLLTEYPFLFKENGQIVSYNPDKNELYNKATYYYGFDDYNKAIKYLIEAAKHNLVDAQFDLGYFYFNGIGTNQDYEKAFYWYAKAAKQGHDKAQCNLGLCYYKGNGVNQDITLAIYWYKKAAAQNNPDALNSLGVIELVENHNEKSAFEWFEKAAIQGHPSAQYNIGRSYFLGINREKDLKKGLFWLEQAALQGHGKSIELLNKIR